MILKGFCKICGKEFEYPHWRKGTALYCSIDCQRQSLHAEDNVVCTVCGKPFHLKPSHIKKRKGTNIFCSRKCFAEYKKSSFKAEKNHQYGLKGEKNASFKGVELKKKNNNIVDIRVYAPQHPYKDKQSRVLKHRLIVEQNHTLFNPDYFESINGMIILKPQYQVHHIDGNHDNNDVSNLQVVTKSEHTAIHNKEKLIVRDKLGRITAVLKQGELLENHKTNDNQQPSLSGNAFEGSTTNSRVQTDNAVDSNADTSALLLGNKNEDIV